jgi:hypothetical protein
VEAVEELAVLQLAHLAEAVVVAVAVAKSHLDYT